MRRACACGPALIDLFELISVDRVCQEIGEVRKQIEIVVEAITHDARARTIAGAMPFGLRAIALRGSPGGIVERAIERRGAGFDGALRDLVARCPVAVIAAERDAEALAV